MASRWMRATAMGVAGLLVILAGACHGDNSPTSTGGGGSGASNLVASASTPTDGNGTMTATGTLTVNSGGSGVDEADLSETVGGVGHEVTVDWDTNTHTITAASHFWGGSGFTGCYTGPGGTPCDPSKITLDFNGHTVTFNGQVLADLNGGSQTSTLTGTLHW